MEKQCTKPLFRDPVYDGASDPAVIYNRKEQCWYMLYTQRRASDISVGVSNIHGSKIGMASSATGQDWVYRGTLEGLDFEPGHNTFWAPEVIYAGGQYHMYVSYITGIPTTWDYPRQMIHYTSDDLWNWTCHGSVSLSSDRVIDACVHPVAPGIYKMWYKDEGHESHSYAAVSRDLFHWEPVGPEITDVHHEGPNVFSLGGKNWMITDFWQGLGVYYTDDFKNWQRQPQNILDNPACQPLGHHADVLVQGEEAYIFYFVHPQSCRVPPEDLRTEQYLQSRTEIHAGRLTVQQGILCCNHAEPCEIRLEKPTWG